MRHLNRSEGHIFTQLKDTVSQQLLQHHKCNLMEKLAQQYRITERTHIPSWMSFVIVNFKLFSFSLPAVCIHNYLLWLLCVQTTRQAELNQIRCNLLMIFVFPQANLPNLGILRSSSKFDVSVKKSEWKSICQGTECAIIFFICCIWFICVLVSSTQLLVYSFFQYMPYVYTQLYETIYFPYTFPSWIMKSQQTHFQMVLS